MCVVLQSRKDSDRKKKILKRIMLEIGNIWKMSG